MKTKKILALVSAAALTVTSYTVASLSGVFAETGKAGDTVFFENFEGYEEVGGDYTAADTMNDLYADGWSVATDNQFIARNEADSTQNFAKIVKDGNNKVLELSTSKYLGRMLSPLTETPSGSYEVSFRFKPVDLGKKEMLFDLSLNCFNETPSVSKHNILYSYNGMKMGHRINNITVPMTQVGTAEAVWYDVKSVVNNDGGYYSVELYKEGEFVARRGAINYAGDEKIGYLNLSGFGTTIYVDDVSIKPCEPETLIYEDDFESYGEVRLPASQLTVGAAVTEAQSREGDSFFEGYTPWRALKTFGNTYDLVYDTALSSQVVKLGDDSATAEQESTGMILMPLEGEFLTKDTQLKRGKLRLSYKFRHFSQNGYASAVDVLSDYNYSGKWDYPPQVAIQEKGLPRPAVAGLPYLRTSDAPVKINQDSWYDAEVIFDVINDDVTITVKEHGTGTEIAHFTHDTNWINPASAPVFDKIKAINFRAMSGSSIYIDDVKLEYYITKPEISGNSIIITDYKGEIATDRNNVPVAVKSIELPFGCEMTAESTNPDSIRLSDGKGRYLNYTAEYTPGSYIIKPDKFLTPGGKYTLTVPATAANTFGRELGDDFTFSFTTASAYPVLMELTSTSITDMSDITNGSVIEAGIAYANSSDEALNGLAIVAYYGDNMLLATSSVKTDEIAAGEMGTKTVFFTVPDAATLDMSKADKISVCLWKGFKNSVPYCSGIDIGTEKNAEPSWTVADSISKPVISYSYTDSVLNISGEANEDNKYLTVQIIKPGNTFDTGEELESEKADKLVFYRAQIPVINGKYSLDMRFDDSGDADSSLEAGDYPTTIYLDDTKLDIESVYLCSSQAFEDVCSELNAAAKADDFTLFKNILNNKRAALNFNNEILGDTDLGDEIKPYFEYVKKNPISAENEVKNSEMFNTYVVIQYLNDKKIDNIKNEIPNLLIDDEVKDLCDKILTTKEKGKYFTGLISGKKMETPGQLEKEISEALILTTAKYGNGYGELRDVLESCGSEIGIKAPISSAACRAIMGKSFKDGADFKSAYDNNTETQSTPSKASGSGGGGGGRAPISSAQLPVSDVSSGGSKPEPVTRLFNDIDNYEWATVAILALADKNIIHGVAEDRFDPSKNITREEFAKILVGALGAADFEYKGNVFADASESDWFVKYINIAAGLGVVKGIGNGMFGSGQSITRQDMAVMLYNALLYRNVNMSAGGFKFDDDGQIAPYAKGAVYALYEMGAINGMTETAFEPEGLATRAQAAKIVYSVLKELQG